MSKLNSMQSLLRKFHPWFEKNFETFQEPIAAANDLFFGEREGLASVGEGDHMDGVFNEWSILDFSLSSFSQPVSKRKNFLQCFLEEETKLTKAEKEIGVNLQKSYRSLYEVNAVENGMYLELTDLFFGTKHQLWDVSASKHAKVGNSLYIRIIENEKGKEISGGVDTSLVFPEMARVLKEMILMTLEHAREGGEKWTLEEFLKWNSYIYIRDIYNPQGFLESFGE